MSVSQLIALANQLEQSGVGYDQSQRWTWLDRQNKTILNYAEADCSAACLGLAWLAGYPVAIDGTAYTGNAEELLTAAGFTSTDISSWPLYRITSEIQTGDMLLGPGHIVLVGTPTSWLSAEHDERGASTGGQAGDQTGQEVRWRPPYMRSKGWTRRLRPPADDTVELATPTRTPLTVDGDYGPRTKRALQEWLGVTVDGVIGPKTKVALQKRLKVKADGQIGPVTIKALQKLIGTTVDGLWGPNTTRALQTYLNQQLSAQAL